MSDTSDLVERLVKIANEEWDESPSGEGLLAGKAAVIDFLHQPEAAAELSRLAAELAEANNDKRAMKACWNAACDDLARAEAEAKINMENFKATNRAYVKHDARIIELEAQLAAARAR